ncbi:hypothetical protein [Tenacibaculum agarivorans]|uniref:hypothetical protein n=1 Tax=Tenacibaculum agarivorans TaxID=1908389 RepID=UPI00094BBF4F|nr:hypothetical protein [Tenacibaculum agarivorans]
MKKQHLILFLFSLITFNIFPQFKLSRMLSNEPVHRILNLRAGLPTSKKENDSINKEIENTKLKIKNNKFKYAVEIIDPDNHLYNLGQYKSHLTAMTINGHEKVKNPEEADHVFKYTIRNVIKIYEGVKPTREYSEFGRPYYYATGNFVFDVCFEHSTKEKKGDCFKLTNSNSNTIRISTGKKFYNGYDADDNWKSISIDKAGKALDGHIREHFALRTHRYTTEIPRKIRKGKFFKTYLYLFKNKGNRKNLKKKSDDLAREVISIIDKHYKTFSEISDEQHKCKKVKTEEEAINCFITSKKEVLAENTKLLEAMNFWKNEILNKYNTKGKKITIRSVMAANLLSVSYLLKNHDNINFAMNILKEEKTKIYYKVKDEIPDFTEKPYQVVPNYYDVRLRSKGKVISGYDYIWD